MKQDLNEFKAIGFVGNQPTLRYAQSGSAVANFSLATNGGYVDKVTGEEHQKTQWHRCVAFGKLAEIIHEHVNKGSQLFIGGRVEYGNYVNSDDVEVPTTDIILEKVQFLGKKPTQPAQPE